jgi:hypothetical protein
MNLGFERVTDGVQQSGQRRVEGAFVGRAAGSAHLPQRGEIGFNYGDEFGGVHGHCGGFIE